VKRFDVHRATMYILENKSEWQPADHGLPRMWPLQMMYVIFVQAGGWLIFKALMCIILKD